MNSSPELAQVLALSEATGGLPDWARNSVQVLLDQLQQQAAEAARLSVALKHAEAKNQALTLELAHLRRLRFGVKSEALTSEQRDLFQETLETDIAACEAEAEAEAEQAVPEAKSRAKRPRAGRQPLPEHLPRIEHRHEPESCTCGQCGQDLVKIGEDISEQLDVEPARFFVHRHIRPQYACRACETITAAPIPPRSSTAAWPPPVSWPRWRLGNTPTTCPCTGSNRWPRARKSSCRVPPWRNGWDAWAWP